LRGLSLPTGRWISTLDCTIFQGAVVEPSFTAHKANGEEWIAVRLPNSPVHGYLLRSSIVEDSV
jgi:hypothetical protein